MLTFNVWRLVEQGDQLILAAVHELHLLEAYGAELSQSRHNQARSLLEYANDIKHTLNNKHPLARIKPARLYVRKASEALETIKAITLLRAVPLNTNTLNRPTRL